jgi:BirA family biotin operon repressor/biotin-[acetyl-CoA-carboxylase] ligase
MTAAPLRPVPGTGKLGGPIVHLDVTGSTNDRARELALEGAPAGTVVVAEQQTAGRGRQGRSWSAPRGTALTLSALLRPKPADLPLLPLACAVAVCETCEAVSPVGCQIKWPNDVLIDGRKVAGILIESRPGDGWAVVGIGLNVDISEDELDPELRDRATSLLIAGGAPVGRDGALAELLERLAAWTGAPASEPGRLLGAYRERDALRGRAINWQSTDGVRRGTAAGIDDSGNLVAFGDDGTQYVLDAGEVHLGR